MYLKPPTKIEFQKFAEEYFKCWNIPDCLGALDGKDIVIQDPQHSGCDDFSYKKIFSAILMATCDSYYRFTLIDIGSPEATHDATVFSNSIPGAAILNKNDRILSLPNENTLSNSDITIPYFVVADQAFPLRLDLSTS